MMPPFKIETKMRTPYIFFLITLLISLQSALISLQSAAANTGQITGQVKLNPDNETLAGVNVRLLDSPLGAITDEQGEFRIEQVPAGSYVVEASHIGYSAHRQKEVTVEPGSTVSLNFYLKEHIIEMDQVVVTGTLTRHMLKDTPVITEVISLKSIRDIGSSNLVDVMQEQTGIDISNGIGRVQSAQVQGLSDNHVLVLIDGERTTGSVDGALDLGQIPVDQIERVEVVKGPLSSVYGSEAMGGVINIITKQASSAPRMKAGITVGSNGRQDYTFSLAREYPKAFGPEHDLSLLLSSGWNKYFGVDYDERDNFMELPDYDRKNVNLKAGYNFRNEFEFDLRLNYYEDEMEWLAGTPQNAFIDYSDNQKYGVNGVMQYHFSPKTHLKFVANYSQNNHGLQELTGTGSEVKSDDSAEEIQNYRLQMTTSPYNASTLSFGLERKEESIDSDRVLDQFKSYSDNVAFVEDEWTISDMTFTVGGRYSDNTEYGSFFAPKVSLMFRAMDNLKTRFSYGRGFRKPSLKELYIDFHSTVGYIVEGEPNLEPEKSHGFNLGLEYHTSTTLWFRTNIYYNIVENLIDYYPKGAEGDATVLSYYNVHEATTRGIDINLNFNPLEHVGFVLGYNYTRAEDSNGNELPYRVPHSFNWKLRGDYNELGLSGNIRGQWYDSKLALDDQTNNDIYSGDDVVNTFRVPSYAVWDISLEKSLFQNMSLFGGVNNIFDKTYYPFGQIKGREFYIGASYQLQ